jgi:hypothetical protein
VLKNIGKEIKIPSVLCVEAPGAYAGRQEAVLKWLPTSAGESALKHHSNALEFNDYSES